MILKKYISSLLFLILIFYHIYPAGMPLFGYSFLFTSGLCGLLLYAYNSFPYTETVKFMLFFGLLFLWALLCTFINPFGDLFIFTYSKSQIGFIFSAYLVIYFFYKLHPTGGIHILLYYVVAAVALQCIISVWMYADPAVNDFFNSLQKLDQEAEFKRNAIGGRRFVGYGAAFFGAGLVCGVALILLMYVMMTRKFNLLQMFFATLVYVFIFFVGLLSARTVTVGAAASLVLMLLIMFKSKTAQRSQSFSFLFFLVVLLTAGVTIITLYLPEEIIEWAFEPFMNLQESGEFRTYSSDMLADMFLLPGTVSEWLFGWGRGGFWGSDVGFTRLLFWVGLPGTIIFFTYQYLLAKESFSNNKAFNITLLIIYAYNLGLNVKGFSDLNTFFLLFAFYFLHYKYYIYTPYLYKIGKIRQTSLRYAVQGTSPRRRI